MELTMEKKEKEGLYIITRNDDAIKRETWAMDRPCSLLNALLDVMRGAGYQINSIEETQEVIAKGATLYVKEKIVANADEKAIKSMYGFVLDRAELIKMAPVPDSVKEADAITSELRKGIRYQDYTFDGDEFKIKATVRQAVIDRNTRYASSKREERIVRRLKEVTAEFNDLRQKLIDYAPSIYQDQWSHPEQLLTWDPVTKSYKPDLESLVKIFNLRKVR